MSYPSSFAFCSVVCVRRCTYDGPVGWAWVVRSGTQDWTGFNRAPSQIPIVVVYRIAISSGPYYDIRIFSYRSRFVR